jgi:hypothetical protein
MNEAEDQEVRRRRNPLLWPLRFLLHWIIKSIVLVFLGIGMVLRPRPVRYGVVAILVLGIIAWALAGQAVTGRGVATAGNLQASAASRPLSTSPADSTSAEPISVPVNRTVERAPVVEQYLKAQSRFDANSMWDSISDNMKQQLQASSTDVQSLQDQLDQAKQSGRSYSTQLYVGGVPMDTESVAYFYVITVETPNGATRVPYIYVVGKDGKIDAIQ